MNFYECWEPRRDFLIGHCGKTELEAEKTSWTELHALEKGYAEKEYTEWDRTRMLAHTVYLFMPYGGENRELDRRKFFPLTMDKEIGEMDKKKENKRKAVPVTPEQVRFLDKLFGVK